MYFIHEKLNYRLRQYITDNTVSVPLSLMIELLNAAIHSLYDPLNHIIFLTDLLA